MYICKAKKKRKKELVQKMNVLQEKTHTKQSQGNGLNCAPNKSGSQQYNDCVTA